MLKENVAAMNNQEQRLLMDMAKFLAKTAPIAAVSMAGFCKFVLNRNEVTLSDVACMTVLMEIPAVITAVAAHLSGRSR